MDHVRYFNLEYLLELATEAGTDDNMERARPEWALFWIRIDSNRANLLYYPQ